MLKRIRNLFRFSEPEDLEDDTNNSVGDRHNYRKLETKITYEYPRETPFRFPVIPDEELRENNYRTNRQYQKQVKKQRDHQSHIQVSEKPFTPSQVVSPIYGYRRKIDADIQNLPAFIRKQKKDNLESEKQKKVEPIDELKGKTSVTNIYDHKEKKEQEISLNQNKVQMPRVKEQSRRSPKVIKEQPTIPIKENYLQDSITRAETKDEIIKDDRIIPMHLLNDPIMKNSEDRQWVKEQQKLLEQTLTHFNVQAKVVHATQGPTVTRFEVQPELGVKVSRVRNLSDDIKMNMAARDIRIEAPIPGKNTIGIEVPNLNAQTVGLQEIIDTNIFRENTSPLTVGLGLSIEGNPHITTLDKMPHGLIAGATGSGKSVCINTILISLLYKSSHKDVKLLLIDPKMVELAPYNDIPHLVAPVITDVKAATAALKWAVEEMEGRYERFVEAGVRDIHRFNQKANEQGQDKMPHIVIIIDELADLMMASPQDVEDAICRIAQKARACGMHLLLATQRPSVDVITGLIKANIPTRIAFSVSSQVDSRTIIDTNGAERLLGKGDMLFIENGSGKSVRLQGAFVSDDEIERVTAHVKSTGQPNYLFHQEQLLQQIETDEEVDELFEDVIQFILEHNQASTSLLQRHFRIGYNRAARLIDTLESRGMISEQNGSKPRDVLFTIEQLEQFI